MDSINGPLVSIILLTYNYGKYLDQCLGSIELQTYKNYEIIIIDDSSTDEYTINYLNKIKNKYKFIETNRQGPSVARNEGIKNAQGDFILFLDADDYLESSYLEVALKEIHTHNADFFYPSYNNFGAKSGTKTPQKFSIRSLLFGNYIIIESLLKKEIFTIGNVYFDEQLKTGLEDREFWIRVVSKGYKGITSSIPTVNIRRHNNSRTISANKNKKKLFDFIYKNNSSIYLKYLSKKEIFILKGEYFIEYYFSSLRPLIHKVIKIIPKSIRNKIKGVNKI